jgi:hypothetical protein
MYDAIVAAAAAERGKTSVGISSKTRRRFAIRVASAGSRPGPGSSAGVWTIALGVTILRHDLQHSADHVE